MIVSWRAFEERIGIPVPEGKLPEGGHYTVGRELCAVLALAKKQAPKVVCEIGTAFGDTAAALGRLLPDAFVHTFDVCRELGGYDLRSVFAQREVPAQADCGSACKGIPNVTVHCLPGAHLRDSIRAFGPYDFVFIDGGHRWRDVVDDTKAALAAASENCMIVWDDYWFYCPEVGHFLDIMNERTHNMVCHVADTRLCFSPMDKILLERFRQEIADL